MDMCCVHGAETGTTREPFTLVGSYEVNDNNSPHPLKHACLESL
jgi:hypothetical protein